MGRAFVDGRTVGSRTWRCMCLDCHAVYGAGFGTGFGQRYDLRDDGKYHRVRV
jgi:hypothetical protein